MLDPRVLIEMHMFAPHLARTQDVDSIEDIQADRLESTFDVWPFI